MFDLDKPLSSSCLQTGGHLHKYIKSRESKIKHIVKFNHIFIEFGETLPWFHRAPWRWDKCFAGYKASAPPSWISAHFPFLFLLVYSQLIRRNKPSVKSVVKLQTDVTEAERTQQRGICISTFTINHHIMLWWQRQWSRWGEGLIQSYKVVSGEVYNSARARRNAACMGTKSKRQVEPWKAPQQL